MRLSLPVSVLLSLAPIVAQVPVGSAIHGSVGDSATPLIILNRTPTVTTITGAVSTNINGLRLDPMDGSVWMVSTGSPDLRRGNVSFATATFINETVAASLGVSGPAAIAFDIDCNPVVGGGSLTGAGGLFRVGRTGGAITPIVNSASGLTGTVNAVDEDPVTGDIYFGVFGTGEVFKISPPYTLNSQVSVGTVAGAASSDLSGLSFVRPASAPGGILYVSAFAAGTNASLVALTPSGVATAIPGTPPWGDLNWVDYDEVRNDLWVVSTFGARSIYSSSVGGANAFVHQIPSGTPACIEVNDVDTTRAELRVCPRNVPAPTAPIRLEITVAGNPGEVAVVAILSPLVLLGVGPVGADGLFTVAIPNVRYPAGAPGTLPFLAATVDTTALTIKFSNNVGWPRN